MNCTVEFDSAFGYHVSLRSASAIIVGPCGNVEGNVVARTHGKMDIYLDGKYMTSVEKSATAMGRDIEVERGSDEDAVVVGFGRDASVDRHELVMRRTREMILEYYGLDPKSSATLELPDEYLSVSADGGSVVMRVKGREDITRSKPGLIVVRGHEGAILCIDGVVRSFARIVLCDRL